MPQDPDVEPHNNVQAQTQHNNDNPSHLFLVRLWTESNNEGEAVWCGKVQHVTRGKANQFRDWPTLIDHLTAMLPNADRVRHHRDAED
ncbi:MAG: hypothetical protein M3437_19200 [Chloroflexota bacterium]|nr:hypothetical protein [Chloroflexota bacterium]MDQ5867505.1 hypothetical protein [Chloroflexota bacterium]